MIIWTTAYDTCNTHESALTEVTWRFDYHIESFGYPGDTSKYAERRVHLPCAGNREKKHFRVTGRMEFLPYDDRVIPPQSLREFIASKDAMAT